MKVKINTAIPSVSKGGKSFQKINYDNDQKASAWDSNFVPFMGKEVEVDITEKDGFKNIKLVGAAAAEPAANASAPTKETSEVDVNYKSIVLSLEVLKATAATITEQSLLNEAVKLKGWLLNGFAQENKG